jgi:H/ACA ribonucleoprotein complex subunit 3
MKCEACGRYTMEEACPRCGGRVRSPHPPRFSLQDPYLDLRLGEEHIRRLLSGDTVDEHEDPDP